MMYVHVPLMHDIFQKFGTEYTLQFPASNNARVGVLGS